MAFLSVERGNEKGRRVELSPGKPIVFGRDPSCDVVTTDHLCSPRHFEIFEKDRGYFVQDAGSEGGTYVNERRISHKYHLRSGDMIHAGETQLVFDAGDSGPAKAAGRMVGGYRILEKLGRGGMGAVYKANQVSLNRIVALKILSHRISADPAFVKRFQSEAQAAGRLNHPNIVQVYDVGFDQGVHFYSMEFIENGSVQDLATRVGTVDLDLALSIITDAARGLVYAEKRGMVHRDIKPDNLMINSEGIVKIADLGLALDAGERARHAGEGSQEEEDVFGTPQFISPEQAQGKAVDSRSDIYSLGASFYRLVTGRPPFAGESITEIVGKQIEEDPEPVRELRPECPVPVAAIIERAMQKDPAARFQSAQEMLTALEAADENPERGKRGALVAAGIAVLALAGAGAWFVFRDRPEERPVVPPVVESRPDTRSSLDVSALVSAQRERDAARAAREAIDFEKQAIASGKPDPVQIRRRYQDVATRFGDTPDGRQAAERVAAIDREIAEAAERVAAESRAAESRAAAAKAVVAAARGEAAEHESADRFSAALRALRRARTEVAGSGEQPGLEEAIRELGQRTEARANAIVADAGAAESEGRTADAEKLLADAAAAFVAGEAGADPNAQAAAARLQTGLEDLRDRVATRRTANAAHDAAALDRARKDAYRSLLMAFDTEAAVSGLEAARAGLKVPASAELISKDREMIDAMARLRDRWTASISGDDARGTRIKIPVGPDRKRLVDHTALRADAKGITVKRGAAEAVIPFGSLSASEAYDLLFSDLVEKDPSVKADAIEFLLFLGLADRALEVAQGLPEGDPRQRALARIGREQKAWAILADVRDLAQRAQSDETVLGRLYREVTRLIADFADTRAYLLHRRSPVAGRPDSRPKGQ
jgi:serine/threonine protein kinase